MYFVTYTYEHKENYGLLNDDKSKILPMDLVLGELEKDVPATLSDFIETYSDDLLEDIKAILAKFEGEGIALEEVKLNAPIPHPRRNVFSTGKNYVDHVKEVKSLSNGDTSIPKLPVFFNKIADPAIGQGDYIIYPRGLTEELDYEVELALVLGKDGKNIPAEEAYDYIFGYTIVNDVSARDVQVMHGQWLKGKSMDTFLPMGPYLAHKSAIENPENLKIECRVNGELRQSSNTQHLIFDIPYIISSLSQGMTLKAGDVILTGTPAGVGAGYEPPKFLKPGDVIECSIEGLGVLRNTVK